jgi:hypothetical protein
VPCCRAPPGRLCARKISLMLPDQYLMAAKPHVRSGVVRPGALFSFKVAGAGPPLLQHQCEEKAFPCGHGHPLL